MLAHAGADHPARPAAALPGRENALLPLTMLLGAVVLGCALQVNNGAFAPLAFLLLCLAYLLVVLGLVWQRPYSGPWAQEKRLYTLAGLGLALQAGLLLVARPGFYMQVTGGLAAVLPFFGGLVLVFLVCLTWLWPFRALRRIHPGALVLVYLMIGVWMLKVSPSPMIDVFVFQKDGAAALAAGQNPYTLTYPDAYGYARYYGPEWMSGGRFNFGFPYLPLSLWMVMPGYLLAGDPRYAHLLAAALSAWLMAYARPGRLATGAMALFLFTPRAFYVLEQSWTEPLVLALFSLTIFLACRGSRWWPVTWGFMLVSKQYMLFTLPLVWLLLPQPAPGWKALGKLAALGAGAALAVTLPLALWDLPAFWRDVVTLHAAQQFRPDSLSFMAAWVRAGGLPLPSTVGFVAAALAVVLAVWRAPRTPAGFAAGMSLALLTFFAFNKQAFCNYYYLALGTMCWAAAVARPPAAAPQDE